MCVLCCACCALCPVFGAGDTWLYGCPSDPLKNVVFREMSRRRAKCVEQGKCHVEDKTMQRFDRLLTKIPEHTWGEDTTW